MGKRIGVISSLNYNYDAGQNQGYIATISVKLTKANQDSTQYNLIDPDRFEDDYKSVIKDVFHFINSLELSTIHSDFKNINFNSCHFDIDVIPSPVTPIEKLSGDSAGTGIFLAIISAFFEIPIPNNVAITGNLPDKKSGSIGYVGGIKEKISPILNSTEGHFNKVIIPNLNYLRSFETTNPDDLTREHQDVQNLINLSPTGCLVIYCRSIFETFKYIFQKEDYLRLLYHIKKNKLCEFENLYDDIIDGVHSIYSNNIKPLNDLYSNLDDFLKTSFYCLNADLGEDDLRFFLLNKKVDTNRSLAESAEKYWKAFASKYHGILKLSESKSLRKLCLDEYLNKVAEKHRYLDLKYLRNLLFIEKPVKLEKIYIQLKATKDYPKSEASHITEYMQFLSGTTKDFINKNEIIEKAHSIPYSIEQILNDALNNKDGSNKHMVLLGPPGSGKSTLLRYLASTIASGKANEWGLKGFIPIYIDLASLSRDNIEDLVEYAKNESANITYSVNTEKQKIIENAIQQVLNECIENTSKDGKVIFLIDALDEAGDKKENIVETIEKYSNFYKKAIFIVTSRIINYHVCPINNFKHYLIEDLHINDITQFITDWFQTIAGEDAQYKANNFIDKITTLSLKRITTNPLYLTFLISIASDPDTIIPETRAQIFKLYFNKLLFNWEEKQELPFPSDKLLEGFNEICSIIHRSLFGSVQTEPSIDSIKKYLSTTVTINPQKLIDFWVNAGIFIKVKSRQHDEFLIPHHLSFIEYGFACKLVNLWENPKKRKELWEDLKINLYNNHLYEPLMLFTGLLDNPNIFLKQVGELQNDFILNNLIFLSDAISEVRNKTLDKKIKINTLHKCIELWQSQNEIFKKESRDRLKFTESIGKLEDESIMLLIAKLSKLCNETADDDFKKKFSLVAGKLPDKKRLAASLLNIYYEKEHIVLIKIKLAELIGKLGDKSTIPLLEKFYENEPDDHIKSKLAKLIGKLGNTKLAISLLTNLYKKENQAISKLVFAESISELGDKSTIPLLEKFYENEPDDHIKSKLAKLIGKLRNKKLLDP